MILAHMHKHASGKLASIWAFFASMCGCNVVAQFFLGVEEQWASSALIGMIPCENCGSAVGMDASWFPGIVMRCFVKPGEPFFRGLSGNMVFQEGITR